MFRRLTRFTIPLALACAMAIPTMAGAAAASNTSPDGATVLTNGSGGSLAGATGGDYNFFKFQYPGDSSQVTIDMAYGPADPVLAQEFNFNVFAPDGTLVGTGGDASRGPGFDTFQLSSTISGQFMLQIYNYSPGQQVNYSLQVAGLPQPPASAPAAKAQAATPASPAPAAVQAPTNALTSPVSAHLAGNSGGAYATYTVAYPGNNANDTITMTVDSTLGLENHTAGFNVYDLSGNLIGSGQAISNDTATYLLTFPDAATYTVQVFNFDPTTTIDYTLSLVTS
jgi:hypothetical protein